MRGILTLAAIALTCGVPAALAADPSPSPEQLMPPEQLIKDVVFNELSDHQHHAFFEYLDCKRIGQQTLVKAEVETRGGRVNRMLEQDGHPLTDEEQREESRRLQNLLHDTGQQQKLQRDYQGDEDRIARIIGLLPDGFLYRYDGIEGGEIRLKYQPNPSFRPPTYEARVFHGMAGTLWIDLREKRLRRLQGQLIANVDFGYGLLGRLDKGGTFDMERLEVTTGNWKTRVLNVHISGHVILLKNIGKDQDEVRSDFRQVPSNLDLQGAEVMLNQVQIHGGPPVIQTGAAASLGGDDRSNSPDGLAFK
ncbi:hypothetical protein ACPOL_5959 [Acidisarcina polymorpha]|uniref:Uncharacterized protein n=2 Tax=Acidisarcina polymorpha TaxID=2211140 RepID=A0A2Z5G7G7_9BACT|nr:hypothetical protein ACPOL_5959 [Acidisarcina polymorpha]